MSAASPRRFLSVWLERLATDRIARHSPGSGDGPFATVAPVKSAMRLQAVNAAAARLGLTPGLALADATARFPALQCADADPDADHRQLEAIADWCDRYTPLVSLDSPDGLVLDISGCAHLFGGEAPLCRDLLMRLRRQGFEARIAVADTVGCAWAIAHYGSPGIVPVGRTRKALPPLPVAALRIAADAAGALAQMGLTTIADVDERPRAPLVARFGEILLRRLDQAFGLADEPVSPRLPPPSFMAERRFAEPVGHERDVLASIGHLARELERALERRGQGARRLQAKLFRTDGRVFRIEAGTAQPLRDPARIARLFAEKLAAAGDACDPGFGYDLVRLSALATERLDHAQTDFGHHDSADIAHLVDVLGARFGLRRVTRFVRRDTHVPEFAAAQLAAAHASRGMARMIETGAAETMRPGAPAACDSLVPARPIRLFGRPERIEAVAEVPDGPPVLFRWRRVVHEIAAAEGPERIAMEWWRDDEGRALTRDYFRAESREGVRVWLFREGLYGRETATPRWFLHGLFA